MPNVAHDDSDYSLMVALSSSTSRTNMGTLVAPCRVTLPDCVPNGLGWRVMGGEHRGKVAGAGDVPAQIVPAQSLVACQLPLGLVSKEGGDVPVHVLGACKYVHDFVH